MKLLILCAVLSACVAVSLASPVKIHDAADSSDSAESVEIKKPDNNSSSSEEEKDDIIEPNTKVKDISSDESSEEQSQKNHIVKDVANDIASAEDDDLANDYIIRHKREVIFTPHVNNQLAVKDEGTIKYEKYLKLKRLRRTLETAELQRKTRNADSSEEKSSEEAKKGVVIAKKPDTAPAETLADSDIRRKRSLDSSEEDSSEEQKKGVIIAQKPNTAPAETLDSPKPDTAPAENDSKLESRRRRNSPGSDSSEEDSSEEQNKAAGKEGIIIAKKPDTAPAETLEQAVKTDTDPAESNAKPEARHRRSLEIFSDEDQQQDQEVNEVFIFSQEKQTDSEENFNENNLKNNEYVVVRDKNLEIAEMSEENKNSEEDYAQGCGGNRDDDSNESSPENNETLNDKL